MAGSSSTSTRFPIRVPNAVLARLKAEAARRGTSVASLLLEPWEGSGSPLADRPAAPAVEVTPPVAPVGPAFVPRRVVADLVYVPPGSPVGRMLATARSAAEAEAGRPAMVTSNAEGRRLARQSARGEDFVGGLDAAREKSVSGYAREVERVGVKPLVASVVPVAGTAFPKKDALKRSGKGK